MHRSSRPVSARFCIAGLTAVLRLGVPLGVPAMLAGTVACTVAGVVLWQPSPAGAWDTNTRVYATSTSPYWDVGRRDDELSRLCSLGQFNQKRVAQVYIQFHGEKGRGITGIAKRDFNLRDPSGKAEDGKTYHFYADGTSQCQVFVAP